MITSEDVHISYLPLAHMMERASQVSPDGSSQALYHSLSPPL